jgi:hypothetical protein
MERRMDCQENVTAHTALNFLATKTLSRPIRWSPRNSHYLGLMHGSILALRRSDTTVIDGRQT